MAVPFAPVEVVERTRRGDPVDAESVEEFVRRWVDGTSDDALMAAWCMLACVRGLDDAHADALMRALVASGDRLELTRFGPTGDVVTTGAVGDSVPIAAAPLAAALGVKVAQMASRGLGHAGGTADKLEAIPGMRVDLPLDRWVRQLRDTGIAVAAHHGRLAPADMRLAELRDATGTVPAPAVVAASAMARAIASGPAALHLEIPYGAAAFVPDREAGLATAALMERMAAPWGRTLTWDLAEADAPLGRMVGNALEVAEAGEVLRGAGPDDVRAAAVRAAGRLAESAGVVPGGEGEARAAAALADGTALAAAERWVEAQDGEPGVWTDEGALPTAPERVDLVASRTGTLTRIDGRGVGEAVRWLGAGRLHPDQSIDPVVGMELLVRPGDAVEAGQPLAVIHARDRWAAEEARGMAERWFTVGDDGGA
ncbi:MAG TPA: thymidine phosphorylase [Miltoncostaea sp.]|jgi:pyrimidine-nucleoside phosphorylase|nr:thymidine phosphorylase [Miltoncostaea sp.]